MVEPPGRPAGSVHRLPGGQPFAVEVRPGAAVQVVRGRPDDPVRVVFSDRRSWPQPGQGCESLSLVLPADVADRLFVGPVGRGNTADGAGTGQASLPGAGVDVVTAVDGDVWLPDRAQLSTDRIRRLLGQELRRVRKWRGWPVVDLARATGIGRSTIGLYESGHHRLTMSVPRLFQLAAGLGIHPATPLTGVCGRLTRGQQLGPPSMITDTGRSAVPRSWPGDEVLRRLLGTQLRMLREDRGWSRPLLADMTGHAVTKAMVQSYEDAQCDMPVNRLIQVLAGLGVRPDDVIAVVADQLAATRRPSW